MIKRRIPVINGKLEEIYPPHKNIESPIARFKSFFYLCITFEKSSIC